VSRSAVEDRQRPAGIDPRIQERRAEVRRRQVRRRRRVVVVVVAAVATGVGAWLLLHSSLLSARVVTVVGARGAPAAEVVAAGGLEHDPPLIDVGAATVVGIERLPWVARATVAREWPDGVRVRVVERVPVAAVALGPQGAPGGWALVDRTGRVVADASQPPAGLVWLGGVGAPGAPGTTLRGAGAALEVAASLPRAFSSQVEEVVEGPGGDVTLHLSSPLEVYLGSTVDLHQKFEDVAAVLAGGSLSAGDVVDVSAPATPVVRG
jgi:cell division protein FtsQ